MKLFKIVIGTLVCVTMLSGCVKNVPGSGWVCRAGKACYFDPVQQKIADHIAAQIKSAGTSAGTSTATSTATNAASDEDITVVIP